MNKHPAKRQAFTIPEMLAVVAILTIIISILMPAIWKGREASREVMCKSNQRQIGMAFMSYARDHGNKLPVNSNGNNPGDWLTYAPGATTPDLKWANGPQTGSLFPYVNKRPELYLCPSLDKGVLGSGVGSNGRFDITAFAVFAGANTFNISMQSQVRVLGVWQDILTPIIIEEDPVQLNGNNREGHFANVDVMGQWHFDGGSFAAIDGSSMRMVFPKTTVVMANDFQTRARAGSGDWINMGQPGGYGWWNTR